MKVENLKRGDVVKGYDGYSVDMVHHDGNIYLVAFIEDDGETMFSRAYKRGDTVELTFEA